MWLRTYLILYMANMVKLENSTSDSELQKQLSSIARSRKNKQFYEKDGLVYIFKPNFYINWATKADHIPIVAKNFGEGRIRPVSNPSLCADMHHGREFEHIILSNCSTATNADQQFELTWDKTIKSKVHNMCWDQTDWPKLNINIFRCHKWGDNQLWRYYPDTMHLKHLPEHATGKCLVYSEVSLALSVSECDGLSVQQRWTIDNVNVEALAKWDQLGRYFNRG